MKQSVSPTFTMRKYAWNLPGRVRLGKVIQKSLAHNKKLNQARDAKKGDPDWKPDGLRALARTVGFLNHVSIRNLADGVIQKPNEEVLKAIAPYIYKVQHFDVRGDEVVDVMLNHASTYSNDWESLASLGEWKADLDRNIDVPLSITAEEAQTLLENIRHLQKIIPILERLACQGVKQRSVKQLRIGDMEGKDEFSRSFRAAIVEQGLVNGKAPESLSEKEPLTQAIARFFKLEPASVVAIYNGDRAPSIYELEALFDYLAKPNGEPYLQAELLDLLPSPSESGNGQLKSRFSR